MMKNSYSGIKVDGCCKAFALTGRMAACCIPRALPWARSFCPFRACGAKLAKFYSGRVEGKTSVFLIHKKRSIRHDEEWHIDLFGGCYGFGV